MITPTVTAANLDRCLYCHHLILTAFIYIPAVRGTDLVAPAHAHCVELASKRRDADLPAEELAAAKAKHITDLLAIEALFLPAPAATEAAAQVIA